MTDGQTDGWMDGQTDMPPHKGMGVRTDGRVDGRTDDNVFAFVQCKYKTVCH